MLSRIHPLNLIRYWRSQKGTAAAEFAIILPLIILMLFGAVEIGRLLHGYQVVTKGVRDAGRYISRIPDAVVCNGGTATVDAAAVTAAKNLAISGKITPPATTDDYFLNYWTDANTITVNATCHTVAGVEGIFAPGQEIPRVDINVSLPVSLLWGMRVLDLTQVTFDVDHRVIFLGD